MFGAIAGIVGGLGGAGGIGGIAGGLLGGIGGDLAKNIFGKVFDKVLENAGLPPIVKDALQMAMAGAMGDMKGISQNLGDLIKDCTQMMHPFDASKLEKAVGDMEAALNKLVDIAKSHDEKNGCMPGREKSSSGAGDSWLMKLAEKLGDMLDKKAKDLEGMADGLNKKGSGPKETAKFEAASKEFATSFEAVNNAIKTIGDGLNSAARK